MVYRLCSDGLRLVCRGLLRTIAMTATLSLLAAAPTSAALPLSAACESDKGGANDLAGSSDVTLFCADTSDGMPYEVRIVVNLDVTTLTGSSVVNACTLFNTDTDAFANFALCVAVDGGGVGTGSPADLLNVSMYACNDTMADRCSGATLVPGPYGTQCGVSQQNTDPFPGPAPGPGAAYPADTEILCGLDLADFGAAGSSAIPFDACSYGSMIPEGSPVDCLRFTTCAVASDCDDVNPCTEDACDGTGVCRYSPNAGVFCSDREFCNGDEACTSLGFCGSADRPRNCDDGLTCTLDTCDELNDLCQNDARNSLCSDSLFCTGVEVCDRIIGCQPGTPPSCDDGVSCTTDVCDETVASCNHVASDAACDDGLFCTGAETCDPTLGCQAGNPPDCADAVPCTIDSCDEPSDTCAHVASNAACSDGLFCSGTELCDSVFGCQSGTPPNCADAVGCTSDSCNEITDSCVHVPENAACSDGEFCTGVEICDPLRGCRPGVNPCPTITCEEGPDVCTGCLTDSDCDNSVFCDGAEACAAGGICSPVAPVNCADTSPCTADSCDETNNVCSHVPSDAACDDGLYCNGTETCDAGGECQVGAAPHCSDTVACTIDACDEETDSCVYTPSDALCDDGGYCNGREMCHSLFGCTAGTPITCGGADVFRCTPDTGLGVCLEHGPDHCSAIVPDFAHCICGDGELTPGEMCDPPATAGTFEDCNNLVDDDGDGEVDCFDRDCARNARLPVCDEGCMLDEPCAKFIRDPATITFDPHGGLDHLYIHGRIPITGDLAALVGRVTFSLSNASGAVYRASLEAGDMRSSGGSRRFRFQDRDAPLFGDASSRGGLYRVSLKVRRFQRVPFLVFTIRVFADLSAADDRMMTSELSVSSEQGSAVGFLTAEWTATKTGWTLHQSEF